MKREAEGAAEAPLPEVGANMIDALLAPAPDDTERQLEFELVRVFQSTIPKWSLALNTLFGSMLIYLNGGFNPAQGRVDYWLWLLAVTLLAMGNVRHYERFRRAGEQARDNVGYWCKHFAFGALASGVIWGIGGVLLYTPEKPVNAAFLALVLAGLTAGVAGAQVTLKWVLLGYIGLSLLPLTTYLLLFQSSESAVLLGLMLFIFMLFISQVGLRNRDNMLASIRNRLKVERLLYTQQLSERYFRALIENASDLISVIDARGKILFHSPSSSKILGHQPEELIGRNLLDYIHPEDASVITDAIQGVMQDASLVPSGLVRRRHKDGRWLLLEGEGRLLSGIGTGEPLYVINSRDVTERTAMEVDLRKAKETAEAAIKVKDQFLASMSHEIRTPMNSILGLAEMLRDTSLDERQSRYVNAFQDAGEHLLGLLNDIIDFTRIESGQLQLRRTVFNLNVLLEGVITLLRVQGEAKGLRVSCELQEGLHPWLVGDDQRLRQILVNLVRNAVKFTESGEVRVRVEADDSEGKSLCFSVTDTGVGMTPQQLKHIYEPFFQVRQNLSKGDFGGSGLGLAICQRLLEAMSGSIGVESEPGKGTRFYFSLPIIRAVAPANATANSPKGEVDPRALPAARVLVADDVAMNRLVLKEFLGDTACEVEFASDGQEAVAMAIAGRYDLILMDIQMPLLDGREATRAIRQHEADSGFNSIPIIALTAGALDSDRESAQSAGCDDFLAKPVSRLQLLDLMNQYLTGPVPVET